MKLICAKNELLKSVNISLKAVSSKTTMPILECILIDASATEITFTSNDMELGIETKVKGIIEEKGIVALDAKLFSDIIRKLPDSDVCIQTDTNLNTTITCEKAKFTIPGKSGDDFAYLPVIERSEGIEISQFTLKEVIRQTIFSIAANENNKLMTGELFEMKENILKVVSLDGHRIAIRKIELKNNYPSRKVVVPGKTLNEISKILSGEVEDQVKIFFTDNHIVFEFDDTVVVSRLIEGEGDKKPIIITIDDTGMQLNINSQMGSMNEEIDIDKEGKDIMIGFNPKFLIDALKVIDDEEISIYLVNPKAPCFIKNEEESYIYLILPVNFNTAR